MMLEGLESRTLLSGLPDLIITSVSGGPGNYAQGDSVRVVGTVKNIGSAAFPDIARTIRVYLSTASHPMHGKDYLMGRFPLGKIAAGDTARFDDSLALPDGIPAGNYFVTAIADPLALVHESNEKNNGAGSKLAEIHVASSERDVTRQEGLDPHFGVGGVANVALAGKPFAVTASVADSQGRIVVVGSELDDFTSVLLRINPDGTLDTTFGNNGVITTNVQNGNLGQPLAIQKDGKILLVAERDDSASLDVPALYHLIVLRFNSDGSPDTSFGVNGESVTDPSSLFPHSSDPTIQNLPSAIVLLPDGRFYVGGASYNGHDKDVAVERFTSKGHLDTTFNGKGAAILDINHNDDAAVSIAVQKDEKLIIVGSTTGNDENGDILAARFDTNGKLDATFASQGIFTTGPHGQTTGAHAVFVQPDGKIVLSGSSSMGSIENGDIGSPLYTLRLTSSGDLDPSFGDGGTITTAVPRFTNATASNAFLDPHGRIIIAGAIARTLADFLNDRTGAVLVRYTPDGQIDTTFGVNGIETLFEPPLLLAPAAPDTLGGSFGDFQRAGSVIIAQTPGGGIFVLAASVTDGQTLITVDDVAVDAADLSLELAKPSATKAGTKLHLSLMLHNVGSARAAGATTLTFTIVTPVFSQARTIALAAGGSSQISLSFTLPAGLSPGGYKLIARIDPANGAFFDKNTQNNATSKPLQIT